MNTATLGWCAAAVLAVAGQARAVDKSWNAGNGSWNTGSNWFFAGVPAPADRVFLGSTILAENADVSLNVNATVAGMTITDGMRLVTFSSRLVVNGDTLVSGANVVNNVTHRSTLDIRNNPNFAFDYVTRNLTVTDGALVDVDGGGLEEQGLLQVDAGCTLGGEGVVKVSTFGLLGMRNDGLVYPDAGGLTINQTGTGRIDLDGTDGVEGDISMITWRHDGTAFSNLTVTGDILTDSFSGSLRIVEGGFLTMNMAGGWAMDSNATLELIGLQSFANAARINGSALSFGGTLSMTGNNTHGVFTCATTLTPTANVAVGGNDLLEFDGPATIQGGTYAISQNGRMRFDGATTVLGGTFTTDHDPIASKPLSFDGPTTWNGTVTINGRGSQDGGAQVTGPTTINAYSFDIDGESGVANWTIGDHLTVNATYSDEEANANGFDATMNIGGGAASKLTMNLLTPGDSWYVSGTLNLTGVLNQPTTRIEGSPLWLFGVLNATGAVQVDADLSLSMNSAVAFGTPVSELRVSRSTTVRDAVAFAGLGSLHNLASGGLLMLQQSTLGQTSLINDGSLRVGTVAGSASVHRFTQTQTGSWQVQVGGNSPGVLHDVLRVTGAASTIDGVVGVELIDAGNGQFVPVVGEMFLILDATPGVTGAFDNAPTTVTNTGHLVDWSFVYTPSQVFLRADRITRICPADFNADGFLDFFDYDDFVNCFETGVCPPGKTADFNIDGFTDFFDYDSFVEAFESGC